MLVHDQFVFLQVRKTACTFLAAALKDELPGSTRVIGPGKHNGWSKIPREAAGRPVLAYIRNPWDWYVSWYYSHADLGIRSPAFAIASNDGVLDFEATIRRACIVAPEVVGHDLYSFFFYDVVGDGLESELLTVGRFENLFDDLEKFISDVGVTLAQGGMAGIRARSPVNFSGHGPYRDYYSDELRRLVADSCESLIGRFGYRF